MFSTARYADIIPSTCFDDALAVLHLYPRSSDITSSQVKLNFIFFINIKRIPRVVHFHDFLLMY